MRAKQFGIASVFVCGIFLLTPVTSVRAQTALRLGVLGDSSSDEYRAEDNRAGGTTYAVTTLSWGELLVKYRGVDLGLWGLRSEPRRTGFEYNWSRSGAVSGDLVKSGAASGMAELVRSNRIDVVLVQVGANDFSIYTNKGIRDGYEICNGNWTSAQIDAKVSTVTSNIRSVITTLQSAGSVPIILAGFPDMTLAPHWGSTCSQPQKLKDTISKVNAGLLALATSKGVIFYDQNAFGTVLLSRVDAQGKLDVAGEKFDLVVGGDEPHHVTLSDNIHAGTVYEGIVANELLKYLNTATQRSIAPFSDLELLQNAGIKVIESEVCRCDINKDTQVNLSDYNILVKNFLRTPLLNSRADLTGEGQVNLSDYNIFVRHFLQSCP